MTGSQEKVRKKPEVSKMNELSKIRKLAGANKRNKRVGRGHGCHGKTAGKGAKGEKARSGKKIKPWFEGGQMPFQRRIPKRGFVNIFHKDFTVVNVEDLNVFENGSKVEPSTLRERGIVKKIQNGIKVLGRGNLDKKLVISAHAFSENARAKIQSAGGTVEVIKKNEKEKS
jgi:large subunit ribosomal protein L15